MSSLLSLPAPIAIIDVETTGLFPFRHDRIIEIAAVVIQDDGRIDREFVSLVNPERDIGPSRIHGLTSEDILYAPRFNEIAAQLVNVLNGSVAISGHNVRFDKQFLECEFQKMGYQLPEFFNICTMKLAGGGKLMDCCFDYGISVEGDAHNALTDARATAQLLVNLLSDRLDIHRELAGLKPIQWPVVPRALKQPITREESRRRQTEPPSYLQRLFGRMQDSSLSFATNDAIMAYIGLLDRVLEDRRVDDSEADALVEMAMKWGLGNDQIRLIHHDYLHRLALAAAENGIITDTEQRDLKLVARLLGLELPNMDEVLKEVVATAAATVAEAPSTHSLAEITESNLAGKSVCFTGEMQCNHKGQMISREYAENLAIKAGLVVVNSVTKNLDFLVVADPYTQSSKAVKARRYGIRIIHEPLFWKTIGVEVN